MIYLYESHHGGLYLSARDDLDAGYCPVCGDSDSKMEIYDIEDLEDARHLVYSLFSIVLEEGFSSSTWLELLNDLKDFMMILVLSLSQLSRSGKNQLSITKEF